MSIFILAYMMLSKLGKPVDVFNVRSLYKGYFFFLIYLKTQCAYQVKLQNSHFPL